MRPIWMRIKGLNSFLESQEVDFQKLTRHGLFGIFGPTGSGKSSILDGMTLALYGTTARKSDDFIHVNAQEASVDFIFSIREQKERVYQVSRSFQRSKEGKLQSGKVRFVELAGEQREVLADQVRTVNQKCQEALGLSKEDFFRTVVLPQGNFSEFLCLEGEKRNKMLERIFHLEQYGERFTQAIKNQAVRWEGERKENEGALSRYQEVSLEALRNLEQDEQAYQVCLKQELQALQTQRISLAEQEKQLQYQQEYAELQSAAKALEAERDKMEALSQEIQAAKTAEQLWSVYQEFQESSQDFTQKQAEEQALLKEWEDKQASEAAKKVQKDQAEYFLQVQKPRLELEREKLGDALRFLKEKTDLERVREGKEEEKEHLAEQIQALQSRQEQLRAELEACRSRKERLTDEIQALTSSAALQNRIEQGFYLSEAVAQLQKRAEQTEKRVQMFLVAQKQAEERQQALQRQAMECRRKTEALKQQRASLERKQILFSDLETRQEQLLAVQSVQKLEAELKEQETLLKTACRELEEAWKCADREKNRCLKAKEEAENAYQKNLAGMLAQSLKEGDVCPVCGNRYHVCKERTQSQAQTRKLETEREQAEANFRRSAEQMTRLEIKIGREQEDLQKVEAERRQLDPVLLQTDLPALQQSLEERQKQKQEWEKQLKQLEEAALTEKEESFQIQTALARAEAEQESILLRRGETEEELEDITTQIEEKKASLSELEEACKTKDFAKAYQELQENRKKREQRQKELARAEQDLERWRREKEQESQTLHEQKTKQAELEVLLGQQTERIQQLGLQIQEKAGDCTHPKQEKERLEVQILVQEEQAKQADKQYEQAKEAAAEGAQAYTEAQACRRAAQEEAEKRAGLLKKRQQELGVAELDETLRARREAAELQACQERLEGFQAACLKLSTQMESVQKHLKGLQVSKTDVEESRQKVQNLEEDIREQHKQLGAVRQALNQMRRGYQEKEKLLQKQKSVLHTLDILKELEKLFRGKKFVEYVSRYHLEYLSREADVCLKEMTGNSYGLETDENGMFLIRDYKNGGVPRPVSTLSGGETFMASLALALSLSSQVQLKGTAPLELFFLDEGFGTLDGVCLEEVMTCLERIRNQRRSVGVISHVEEIKARIPVRLLIEPARAGEGGSRILPIEED